MGTLFATLVALLSPQAALAFALSPMSVSLDASGKAASHSFVLDNGSAGERVAVQVSMATRAVAADGTETNPDADDDFIVYPSQLVLGPGEKRTVRVTWAGDPKPPRELAYRIIAEQLPVDTSKPDAKNRAMIKMLLRYLGAVYITPKGAAAKVGLRSLERVPGKKGAQARLALELENTGTAHEIIRSARLTVSRGDATVELGDAELKAVLGTNLLAGGRRRIEIDWPAKLPSAESGPELKGTLATKP